MANIVMGVAGAIIGTYTGVGPWTGFAIGSSLGTVLFPPGEDQRGPRLHDLKVESSAYGTPIPVVYGAARLSGAVIWSTDLVEHEHESGGKGGPEMTTYSYTASFACSICAGPIVGVRRIWSNGTLIYDATGESETNAAPGVNITFYPGSEDQLPDPTMETHLGVGNVPAYRGQAYAVFTDLDLANYGNSIAGTQFEFEVITAGGATQIPPAPAQLLGTGSDIAIDPGTGYVWAPYRSLDTLYIAIYNPKTAALVETVTVGKCGATSQIKIAWDSGFMYVANEGNSWGQAGEVGTYLKIAPVTKAIVRSGHTGYGGAVSSLGLVTFSMDGGMYSGVTNGVGGGVIQVDPRSDYDWPAIIQSWGTSAPITILRESATGVMCAGGSGAWALLIDSVGGTSRLVNFPEFGNHAVARMEPIPPGIDRYGVIRPGHYMLVGFTSGAGFVKLNTLTGEYQIIGAAQIPSGGARSIAYNPDTDRIFVDAGGDGGGAFVFNGTTGAYIETMPGIGYAAGQAYGRAVYLGDGVFVMCENTSSPQSKVWLLNYGSEALDVLTPNPVALSSIVADLSTRSGLRADQIDVSALTDLVDGYAVTRQAPARACIEQLQSAFFFDGVESQTLVRFVKRGQASAGAISRDDLAAHVVSTDPPDWLGTTRKQTVELPQVVDVQYIAQAADYQVGNQRSRRMSPQAGDTFAVELPIVMSDDKARQVADALMYAAWTARTSHQFQTTRKYTHLEPADVVTIDGRDIRIIKKSEADGVIKWEGVAESAFIYSQTSTGVVAGGMSGQSVPTIVASEWVLLDLPLLRDEDNNAGVYVAARGAATPWRGTAVYKSIDGGASYAEAARITTASPIGYTINALGGFAGGNTFDESNVLIVSVAGGTLSSTPESAVLNGANAAAIASGDGWEIIQFKSAALNDDGTYTLSGLLRGRKGTEWAMSGHAQGDAFVLLTTALSRLAYPLEEIGLERHYKGVTVGGTLSTAAARTFTARAVAYECYAPVHLGGGRDADNNVILTWVRRARVGGEWRDNLDAQLSEWREEYDVEIMDATFSTVLRTFPALLSGPTLTYTAAQQIADGLTPGEPVRVRIYQVGGNAGRGYPLQGTI